MPGRKSFRFEQSSVASGFKIVEMATIKAGTGNGLIRFFFFFLVTARNDIKY